MTVCCLLQPEADLQVGEEVEGVVLHIAVDESNTCLELSTDRLLVRSVSRRAERPNMDKARVGQTLKAQVLLVKDDFVLVTLKQHASGTLAFLPRRQVVFFFFFFFFTLLSPRLFPDASLVEASAPESRSATQVAPLEISDS